MDILEILKADYARFPKDQTYSLYSEQVYFKDPLNEFRGRRKYQGMIKFIDTFFINPQMDLHDIWREGDTIKMNWTLSWNTPVPWKPRIHVNGWSELGLNAEGLIHSHIDYWRCSRWNVVAQHFGQPPEDRNDRSAVLPQKLDAKNQMQKNRYIK